MYDVLIPEVRNIVETALKRSGRSLALSDRDLKPVPSPPNNKLVGLGGLERRDSFVYRLFEEAAPDRRVPGLRLYHFKSLKFLPHILKSGTIQASNLDSNSQNDHAEFEEFVRRYSNPYPLIPRGYAHGSTQVLTPENRLVDDYRAKTCILCFTQGYEDPRFWKEYVNGSKGVALEFKFEEFHSAEFSGVNIEPYTRNIRDVYELRDVCYDQDGYLFDFINEITFYLYRLNGLQLLYFVPGVMKMAAWYKRGRYSWEKETRLVFDLIYIDHLKKKKSEFFKHGIDGKREFVVIPFANHNHAKPSTLFNVELSRIIVGEAVSDKDFVEIENLAVDNFSRIEVIRRAV